MRNRVAVLMLCGPRTPTGHLSTIRIFHAIDLAVSEHARLFIAGETEDVQFYDSMARERGAAAVAVYNTQAPANTESNVDAFVQEFRHDAFSAVTQLYVVTDYWHMDRALLHLKEALRLTREVSPEIIPMNVRSAISPTEDAVARERRLMQEFLARQKQTVLDNRFHQSSLHPSHSQAGMYPRPS